MNRCVFPAVMCVITNRIRIIGIFILTLAFIAPQTALADWKIYYTGPAEKMFGSYGRGSFATKAQAEAYRVNRPGFEVNNSYSAGFDSPTNNSPSSTRSSSTQALVAGMVMQSFFDSMNNAAEQAERDRQMAEQQRILEEQRAQAARVLSASHLRGIWDEQDRERQTSLSGTLDVPLQGSAFFGIPSNPSDSIVRDILAAPTPPVDPFANDPNVVDLRGIQNPTPALLRGATDPTPAESGAPAGLQQGTVPRLPTTPNPATRVYQFPESKDKPNREKRILVLGVGSDMTETFVEAARKYKGQYDIIIGTDIEATLKNPILGQAFGVNWMTSLFNAGSANMSQELAQQKYSDAILEQLRRIARPKDPLSTENLEFGSIDMHSKGVLAFSSLLSGEKVSAGKVTAYGPAVGENYWALDNLTAYAKTREKGSVVVEASETDIVTGVTPLNPNLANLSFAGSALATSAPVARSSLRNYLQTHDSQVEFKSIEMPGVTGVASHYLDNYKHFEAMSHEELAGLKAKIEEARRNELLYGGMD